MADIDTAGILLNSSISAESKPAAIGDYDEDGISDLMVKFDRQALLDLLDPGDSVSLTVSGSLTDGMPFEGSETIRIINKSK